MLYDVNGDGIEETLVSTKDGELVFIAYASKGRERERERVLALLLTAPTAPRR